MLECRGEMSSSSPLVILGPRITDDSVSIWRTCLAMGWEAVRFQGWRAPEGLDPETREIAIYGEPLFAEAVCDQLGLVLLEPSIDWLTKIPREYLLRDIGIMTLGEARSMDSPAFVKPADGKIFEPKVYVSGDSLPTEEHVDASIPVLRSGIMDFRLEVRCFVRARSIVTLSPYWRDGDLAQDAEGGWSFLDGEEMAAREFAGRVLDDPRVELPPGCTLDVGRDADGHWTIIEANPCWGAGLYGCDSAEVLKTIPLAIVRRSGAAAGHLPWISKRRQDLLPDAE